MQSKCIMPQLKEIEQLKLSPSTKTAADDEKFITEKHKQCQMLRSLWQNKSNTMS